MHLKSSASLFFSQHSYSAISEDLSKKHLDQQATGPTSYRAVFACLNYSITSEGEKFNE